MSRKLVASIICISAVFVSFFSFEHETIASEKAQRLCLVNSPAELIACNIATLIMRLIFSFHMYSVCTQE